MSTFVHIISKQRRERKRMKPKQPRDLDKWWIGKVLETWMVYPPNSARTGHLGWPFPTGRRAIRAYRVGAALMGRSSFVADPKWLPGQWPVQ
jgi:hypothetical protein